MSFWKGQQRFLLFLSLFSLEIFFSGFLSNKSWFWNDESCTLLTLLENPISNYLIGDSFEGNRMPLFYLAEKGLIQLLKIKWITIDPYLLLRSLAIIPSSIAVALLSELAYFKSKSKIFLIFTFLGLNSGTAVLGYSWQARHYSLWVLESLFFSMALWRILKREKSGESWRDLISFVICAYLLCLTVGFGMIEVAFGLVLILASKRLRFKTFLYIAGIVAPVLLYSFILSRKSSGFSFQMASPQEHLNLILAHGRYWLILTVFMGAVFWGGMKDRKIYFLYLGYLCSLTLFVSLLFFLRADPKGTFTVSNRYFIFLSPHLFYITLQTLPFPIPKNVKFFQFFLILFIFNFTWKLQQRITPIWETPGMTSQARKKLAAILEPANCVCRAEVNPLDIHFWGGLIPQMLKWNAQRAPCDQPLPVGFNLSVGTEKSPLPMPDLIRVPGKCAADADHQGCRE